MEAIDTLSNEKTIIIVAHRMNTIKKCDNILLLNEGVVEASGTYDELSQSSKRFQEMIKNLISFKYEYIKFKENKYLMNFLFRKLPNYCADAIVLIFALVFKVITFNFYLKLESKKLIETR